MPKVYGKYRAKKIPDAQNSVRICVKIAYLASIFLTVSYVDILVMVA